jgi:hypothetical protein
MNYLILNGSPKTDGLCHSVTQEIIRGAKYLNSALPMLL